MKHSTIVWIQILFVLLVGLAFMFLGSGACAKTEPKDEYRDYLRSVFASSYGYKAHQYAFEACDITPVRHWEQVMFASNNLKPYPVSLMAGLVHDTPPGRAFEFAVRLNTKSAVCAYLRRYYERLPQ